MILNTMYTLSRDLNGADILVNFQTGESVELNPTALFILRQIEMGITREELSKRLKETCGETFSETSEAEIDDFLDLLRINHLIWE